MSGGGATKRGGDKTNVKGQWKKPKIGQCLHGARGILFTFGDPSKTVQAVRDFMNILNSTAEILDKKTNTKVESSSVEDALAAEFAALDEAKERFTPIKDLCRCVAFVRFNRPEDCPAAFAEVMFEDAIATQQPKSRFVCSVLPIIESTKPHPEEFRELVKTVVDSRLPEAAAALKQEGPIGWKVNFNARNNREIKRPEAQDHIGALVAALPESAEKFKVRLDDPTLAVLVEMNPKFCGISVLTNWTRYKQYNLMRAAGEELDSTKKMLARDALAKEAQDAAQDAANAAGEEVEQEEA